MPVPILAGSSVAGYEYTYNAVVYILLDGVPILEDTPDGALFLAVKKTDLTARPIYVIPVT